MQEDMHFRMAASALQTTVSGLRNELQGGSSQSREALSHIPPNCGYAFFTTVIRQIPRREELRSLCALLNVERLTVISKAS